MDDIRVYGADDGDLTEALVLLDNHLKGKGLSLNSKKTSIEPISPVFEREKKAPLHDYDKEDESKAPSTHKLSRFMQNVLREGENIDFSDQASSHIHEVIDDAKLSVICLKEMHSVEREIIGLYNKIRVESPVLLENTTKRTIIYHSAYRWRTAVSILKDLRVHFTVNTALIPIWLFGLNHLFWKANHFCWNLNQYGENESVKSDLQILYDQFYQYEWVRYQILSNIALVQQLTTSDMEYYLGEVQREPSELVRFGLYKVLLQKVGKNEGLSFTKFSPWSKPRSPYMYGKLCR